MKKLLTLIITCLCILIFQRCTKTIFEEVPITELPPLERIVYYDSEVADILSTFCQECHSGSSPSASLDLTTFQNVKQEMETGEMWQRLNNSSSPMPPTGQLSPVTLQIIEKWMSDGYPEN